MKPGRKSLAAMLLLLVISAAVVWFGMGDEMKGARDMRFGIDIRGGVEAVFEPVGLDRAPTEAEVTAARNIMESRLDDRNILDREVTADTDRGYVIVRFPWKSGETQFNPEVAIAELGEMANLTFRDEAGTIMLEGKDVSTSSPVESGGNGPRQYAVELHFTEEGAEKFADATGKLTGQRMGIFMDDTIISNPVVKDRITGGNAIIDGMESYEQAKELSDKINAGALPYSMATRNFSTISPSLGASALDI
ncbi:preprotein translocase subunit SecD, partial [Hungatella effluvii]